MRKIRKKNFKKRKISKEAMAIAIMICIIFIIIIAINSLKEIQNHHNKDIAKLSTDDSPMSKEELISKYKLKNEDIGYVDSKAFISINFDRNLFTENESNKQYFEKVIKDFASRYNIDFTLIDENKDIRIEVLHDSNGSYNYKINNIENYFEISEERNIELENYKKIESKEEELNYEDFKKFSNKDWSIKEAGVKYIDKDQTTLYYEGYKVITNDIFIDKIIFDNTFDKEIINGIDINTSQADIKKKLGEPTFSNNDMIGYKIEDSYIFFYPDNTVIYPNINYTDNSKIESMIKEFEESQFSSQPKQRKYLASNIIYKYMDFSSHIDEGNNLCIESPTRGIKIIITGQNEVKTIIYNNYNLNETTKKNIREGNYTSNLNTDFIYETEITKK